MEEEGRRSNRGCILRFARLNEKERWPMQRFFMQCGIGVCKFVFSVLDNYGESEVDVKLSCKAPSKGDTLAILVTVPPAKDLFQRLNISLREMVWGDSLVSVSCGGDHLPVYPITENKSLWRALLPTTPLDTSGPLTLKVHVRDGRHQAYNGDFTIMDKEYPVECIWLSDSKSAIRGGTDREKVAVKKLRESKTPLQCWIGPFTVPTQGDVSTGYGLRRFYNGVFAEGYYHQGVDYAAEEGTPVRAPANGRVLLVGKEEDGFQLHGNCVGLDHGQGVTSILMHLSSAQVVEGEFVKQGDIVGAVGESGLATGPHLHWGFHVNGKAVDPNQWLSKTWWL